jgi:signal transduction histidine kinase
MSNGNLGVQVDIHSRDELGELGNAFNDMSARLAQVHRSRSELLADISHEIRSPLARIQTDAEILADKELGKEEQKLQLQGICEEVQHIDQLMEDLLMLSRIDNNQLKMDRFPCSIEEVMGREASRFSLQMEEKAITLQKNMQAALPQINMDQKRIGQVVSNLLMNAIRYTPAGGTIEIGVQAEGSMIRAWVSDSGQGIPREDLPYIFDRFYRVDKSRSRATGGTGLGLAIARRFVEAHGGKIYAESKAEKGTRITFTLPNIT